MALIRAQNGTKKQKKARLILAFLLLGFVRFGIRQVPVCDKSVKLNVHK